VRLSVSLGLWQDRPPLEALDTALAAEQAGYPELWIGEMATWDAFALATAVGARTSHITFTIGPLPITVRDPAMIAMGIASVAGLTARRTAVALGTSSDVVARDWHGRSREHAATALAESATALRGLLDGQRSALQGTVVHSSGYRLRLPAPASPITVAAFGPAALRVAAQHADRVVLNLVSPTTAAELIEALRTECQRLRRPTPPVATWIPASINPTTASLGQLRQALVGYLAAPGYAAMFRREGFTEIVRLAERHPHPRELLAAIPAEMVATVGLVGSLDEAATRLGRYAGAGVDEVAIVPACSDADPAGRRTLHALATLPAGDPATVR
jgi:probable F420-dependent oxidoreductase